MCNTTKIKYLLAADRVYKVIDINFSNLTLEASETDLLASDVPEEELFDVMCPTAHCGRSKPQINFCDNSSPIAQSGR